MSPEFFDDPYFYEMYNPFRSRYTAMQLESIMGDRVARSASTGGDERSVPVNPAPFVLAIAVLLFLAGVYYISFRSVYTFGTAKRRIRIISRKMIRKGLGEGIQGPESRGWVDWSEEIGERFPDKSKHLRRSIGLMQAGFFGGRNNGGREVKFIRRTYKTLFGRRVHVGDS
jgi:hypothetical protein